MPEVWTVIARFQSALLAMYRPGLARCEVEVALREILIVGAQECGCHLCRSRDKSSDSLTMALRKN